MSFINWLARHYISWDYDLFLPLIARLPLSWGRYLASLRGLLYARLQRDWRQFSFQDYSLYERTQQTMNLLLSDADTSAQKQAVTQRYQMQSIEEWEAACMIIGRDISSWPISYEGIENILALLQNNPHVVFLTAHFGSSILGITLLQKIGIPILVMSSNVVDDPRIHPSISRFYRKKYTAMGHYLNGGQVIDRQGNLSKFIRFLRRDGAVVIIGDLPPESLETAIIREFLGASRSFASGAVKLAKIGNAPLISFVCEYYDDSYHLRFSAPKEEPYTFIDQAIRRHPGAWWAADVLPLLI